MLQYTLRNSHGVVCMSEQSLFLKFTSELFVDGTVNVPFLLLKSYKKIGMNETELVLLLHLWSWQQSGNQEYPTPQELSSVMTVESSQIQTLLAGMVEKKIISIEHLYDPAQKKWIDRFSFAGLFDKLMENWALMKAQQLENEARKGEQLSPEVAQELFRAFEEEFGRLLSPFESNQILEWCHEDRYSPELVIEALRKASLRGIKNLKYIDSILKDWQRNNIRTVKQVEEYEKHFQTRQQLKKKETKTYQIKSDEIKRKIEKYKDVYMS